MVLKRRFYEPRSFRLERLRDSCDLVAPSHSFVASSRAAELDRSLAMFGHSYTIVDLKEGIAEAGHNCIAAVAVLTWPASLRLDLVRNRLVAAVQPLYSCRLAYF